MVLEEQISPIFHLTLLELAEHAILTGIGIATVGILIAMGTLLINAIQIKKQSKISSANLILELNKPWGNNTDFKLFLAEISNPNVTKYDETKVEELLNQLENISIFWKDETLTENHVKEFFGSNLKTIRDDKFIQIYMKKWTDKNPDYYFVNLTKLLKKVKEWNL